MSSTKIWINGLPCLQDLKERLWPKLTIALWFLNDEICMSYYPRIEYIVQDIILYFKMGEITMLILYKGCFFYFLFKKFLGLARPPDPSRLGLAQLPDPTLLGMHWRQTQGSWVWHGCQTLCWYCIHRVFVLWITL
jgi:hypothetical protein